MDSYIDNGHEKTTEKWERLQVMSIFESAIFEKNGCFSKFRFSAPNGSKVQRVLKEILTREVMQKLDDAAHDDLPNILGIQTHRSRMTEPFGPVFKMNDAQMMKFFPKVLRHVYKIEEISTKGRSFNIYATKKVNADGTSTFVPPTVVCPTWNENIMKSQYYLGGGNRYKFGNKLVRQQLQVANLMMAYGLDPDTYCTAVPPGYVARNYSREELQRRGSDDVATNIVNQISQQAAPEQSKVAVSPDPDRDTDQRTRPRPRLRP